MAQSISSNRKTAPQIAVEMRKRVTDQLGKILPTEFSDCRLRLHRQTPVTEACEAKAANVFPWQEKDRLDLTQM
jgi:predicted ATP-dependent Lon-type protease